jgi:hypothetical protein
MLLRTTSLIVIALALGACAFDGMGTQSSAVAGPQQGGGVSVQNIPVFLDKIEAARGKALPAADRLAVGGIATQTKGMLDATQNQFVDKIGAVTGLGGDALRVIVPSAGTPVSDSKLVGGLEQKLGKKLPATEAKVVTAANAIRNNSLSSLKDGFATKVGDKTGVGKDTVTALMPLLGF